MIPLKRVMHLFEVSVPFNMCIFFQMVGHPIEAGHVYFCVKNAPPCACNALFSIVYQKHMVYVNM